MVDELLGEAQTIVTTIVAIGSIVHEHQARRAIVVARSQKLLHILVAILGIGLACRISASTFVAGSLVDDPCVVILASQLSALVQHGFDRVLLVVDIRIFEKVLHPHGTLVRFQAVTLPGIAGCIARPSGDSATTNGSIILIATEKENLASCLANSQVGAEINEIVAELCQACLQHATEVGIIVVAVGLMSYHHDAELRWVSGDIIAKLLHDVVEVIGRLENAMIDGQLVAIHGRPQVEKTHAKRQHLFH